MSLVEEYLAIGAISQVDESTVAHLIPWFMVTKFETLPGSPIPGSDMAAPPLCTTVKKRLIVDARELNRFFQPQHFKMDHWGVIFPT